MNLEAILVIVFFVILISIQYTLNKILTEIKNIRKCLEKNRAPEKGIQKMEREYD